MRDIELSKFLSFVLRHKPQSIRIELDDQGWTSVADLIVKAAAKGTNFSFSDLSRVVANNDKKRFTLSEDGTRIRAAQGHSVQVELGLAPVTPPEILFHGTATRFVEAIQAEGLKPQTRQQVHLSLDEATAVKVGQRHGKPFIFRVDAAAMQAEGHKFYRADNGVWLTDVVPPQFLIA